MSVRTKTLAADDIRHGTVGGYTNWRCRCDSCKAAQTANQRSYRQNLGDAWADSLDVLHRCGELKHA